MFSNYIPVHPHLLEHTQTQYQPNIQFMKAVAHRVTYIRMYLKWIESSKTVAAKTHKIYIMYMFMMMNICIFYIRLSEKYRDC